MAKTCPMYSNQRKPSRHMTIGIGSLERGLMLNGPFDSGSGNCLETQETLVPIDPLENLEAYSLSI